MIVSFAFPSSNDRTGGVTMLYEFANAMARRGHEVHFIHAPVHDTRIATMDDLWFRFDARVQHHIVDDMDDESLPAADVIFGTGPPLLGLRAVIVQGFRLLDPSWDRVAFRAPAPKVCIASWLVDVGRWFGVPEEQLVHVPMGMHHDRFRVRRSLHERTLDVAMLYHPLSEKGWDVGLRMLEELSKRRPDLRAVVFAMNERPPETLPDGIEVALGLDQARLADEVYNATRVMVQSSRHEGFGLTAMEAMGCGAALVTTDCGGSRDYAIPDETALVVNAGDAVGLADRVESLLVDDERRIALAEAGARYVRKFDWERSAELLEAFLERYIADPPSFQRPAGEDRSAEYEL